MESAAWCTHSIVCGENAHSWLDHRSEMNTAHLRTYEERLLMPLEATPDISIYQVLNTADSVGFNGDWLQGQPIWRGDGKVRHQE